MYRYLLKYTSKTYSMENCAEMYITNGTAIGESLEMKRKRHWFLIKWDIHISKIMTGIVAYTIWRYTNIDYQLSKSHHTTMKVRCHIQRIWYTELFDSFCLNYTVYIILGTLTSVVTSSYVKPTTYSPFKNQRPSTNIESSVSYLFFNYIFKDDDTISLFTI